MSTPVRTRVITFQQSHRQRTPRPAPLPLGQTPPISSATTRTFSDPAKPETPYPFSSFGAPITPAPGVDDPRSPKAQYRTQTIGNLKHSMTPRRALPRTPYPSHGFAELGVTAGETTPTSACGLKSSLLSPRPINSPLAPRSWQSFLQVVNNATQSPASAFFKPTIGTLWSSAPIRDNALAEDAIKSPGVVTPVTAKRFQFTSPAPKDPSAAFPTFAGAFAAATT